MGSGFPVERRRADVAWTIPQLDEMNGERVNVKMESFLQLLNRSASFAFFLLGVENRSFYNMNRPSEE